MNTTMTQQVSRDRYKGLINEAVSKYNFRFAPDHNPYVVSRITRDSCTITFYTSGKVLMQGDENTVNAVHAALFGVQAEESKTFAAPGNKFEQHIGADEVGKGDYFGSLIVCACYVPSESYDKLVEEGVGDSKTKSDKNIVKIYEKIKDSVRYRISILTPEDYNKQYPEYMNVAKMLSKLHMDNVHELVNKLKSEGIEYNKVVIDQFSAVKGRIGSLSNGLKIEQMHHAESQDVSVAAASIIARRYFLESMEEMNRKYGLVFPKGATHVLDSAREFVRQYGMDELRNVAKVSFRTTLAI